MGTRKSQKEKFRALVEILVNWSVYIRNAQKNLLYVNPRFVEMFGYRGRKELYNDFNL
jgi:PAS domain-containing protein